MIREKYLLFFKNHKINKLTKECYYDELQELHNFDNKSLLVKFKLITTNKFKINHYSKETTVNIEFD